MERILLIVLLFFQSCLGFTQSFKGSWRGSIEVQGTQLPLVFHLTEDDGGAWQGKLVSPAQSSAHLPLSKVEVFGDSLRLAAASLGLSYAGRRVDDSTINGVFAQGPLRAPLTLRRFVEKVRLRPQTPEPPYGYDTLDVEFTNSFDGTTLAGTVTTPRGKGRFPAVILVTGSGPQDRDETIEGHRPFKVIADYLTKRGIVVLRYDERGVGQSTGNYTKSTIGDFSKDAIAAIDFLRGQSKVNPKKIGIVGHSEGALIAKLIAGQQSAELNFIALLAGPAIPIDSLMVLQAYEIGRLGGMNERQLQQAKVINRKNFAIVKSELGDEHAYRQLLANMSSIIPEPTQAQKNEFRMMVMPSYRYFMRIDPVPFISKIKIPVFAAFGTKDIQVPFAANMESLTDNLPPNRQNRLQVYEGLNHLFQNARTGAISEYAELEETFDTDVMRDLADWILRLK